MNCPKCNAAMETLAVGGIEVERCTGCKGLWFDAREHEKLKDVKGAADIDVGPRAPAPAEPFDPAAPAPKVMCPVCHTPMILMSVHGKKGLRYESCKVCYGAFFDAGEFREFCGGGGGFFKKLFGG